VRHDRFLIAILVAIVLLVAIALGLFFLRQGDQNYSPEDTPYGVVRNYVLALQKKDYERAYGYLHDAAGKPDLTHFRDAFVSRQLDTSNVAVQVGETNRSGSDAYIDLTIVHTSGGPFGDTWRETASALLTQNEAGEWKITRLPFPYWGWDWYPPADNSAPRKPNP